MSVQAQVYSDVLIDGPLIGAIDQGTSSTRFLVFTTTGKIAASAQMEHTQIFSSNQVGWHEHDGYEIWNNTVTCMNAVASQMSHHKLAAIGITNQRETTLAWNRRTGVVYHNAIVWDDTRTTSIAQSLARGNPDRYRKTTGLPLASYFAGTKVKWLLDHCKALTRDLENPATAKDVCFGTIDSWLMYQLTTTNASSDKMNAGGLFVTDVTNASRWLFLDIAQGQWDMNLVQAICAPHVLPLSALPSIYPSSHVYGPVTAPQLHRWFAGIALAAILGDQQAALFGQTAFEPGQAKNTYGTGLFLMMNTGSRAIPSTHGLLTTVAYQLDQGPIQYALEGSVSHSGSTIQWLRDQLQIITKASESETFATPSNDGLYFVPAFAGLFAPHWRSDARGCIVGLTATHHKGHVCRAALEAAAYQAKEVFDAIQKDSGTKLRQLNVDGGGTANRLLMQFQADMLATPVVKPLVMETTAMGAALAAGLAVGVYKDLTEIKALWQAAETFHPKMSEEVRQANWVGWNKAVARSLNWTIDGEEGEGGKDVCNDARQTAEYGWNSATMQLVAVAGAMLLTGFQLGRIRR